MGAQFTPGPWRLAENDETLVVTEALDEHGNCFVIADVLTMEGKAGEHDFANARLIATAPELLKTLDWYADQLCEGWCEQSPDCARFEDCGGCLARRTAWEARRHD